MGNVRIRLVYMNGGGISPGQEESFTLPPFADAYIVETSEGAFTFHGNSEDIDWETDGVLASLRQSSSYFDLTFEPLAEGVFIEPALTPNLAGLFDSGRISIPPTSEGERRLVPLRPDDTINFSGHGLKVAIMAEIADSTSSPSSDGNIVVAKPLQTDVQVKSSNAESDQDSNSGDNATDSSSDDDLDQPITDRPGGTLGEITPVRPRTVDQTIMETPTAKDDGSNSRVNEDLTTYSTAQEAPSSESIELRSNEPARPKASPDLAATSEPYEPREVAFAAASGSMAALGSASGSLQSSTKRKASEREEEEDLSMSSKKQKVGAGAASSSPQSLKQSNSSPAVVVAAQRPMRKRTSKSPPSSAASSGLTGKVPHILLSNDSAFRKGTTVTFLRKQGATIIDDVKARRTHFVCVLNGGKLTTTAKVLRSLALGKLVVTEDWINESKKAGYLLEPDGFVHEDLQPTMNVDRGSIFQEKNLFFTKTLVKAYGKGWKDIQDLAKEAGASHIEVGDAGSFGRLKEGRMEVICFGKAEDDIDVPQLHKAHGVKVYHKNLLTQSILKGELDFDGEEHVLSG